jgi:hypothetical protein
MRSRIIFQLRTTILNNLATGSVLTKILLVLMNKRTAKKAGFAELNGKPPTILRSALFPSRHPIL